MPAPAQPEASHHADEPLEASPYQLSRAEEWKFQASIELDQQNVEEIEALSSRIYFESKKTESGFPAQSFAS